MLNKTRTSLNAAFGCMIALAIASPAPVRASLINDQIGGRLTTVSTALPGITVPFAPTAVVGPGPEFSGQWEFGSFDQKWTIEVDVLESSFFVSFEETNKPFKQNIFDGFEFFGVELTDLDWIDYPGPINDVWLRGHVGRGTLHEISFTDDSIQIFWQGVSEDDSTGKDVYEFIIDSPYLDSVPEPTFLVIWGIIGLLGLSLIKLDRCVATAVATPRMGHSGVGTDGESNSKAVDRSMTP